MTAGSDRPISILLVDDHPALRAGLRSILAGEPGLEVDGEAGSREEAREWYRARRPDVVIMDITTQGWGGLEAIRRTLMFDPRARMLAYTVHTTEAMLSTRSCWAPSDA